MKNEKINATSKLKKALVAIAICGALTGGSVAAGVTAASAKDRAPISSIQRENPWGSSDTGNYGPQAPRISSFTGWGVSWQ